MAKRLRRTAAENPVQFTFDGEPYVGAAGDSLAVALWAAGLRSLSRSPKYHRPRGPFCFTGQCEGCLVRVQGTPNTMACQVTIAEGMRAEAQNYLGAREFDLLRAADFMFPAGLNHHEFLAGVPVAEDLMKAMARRIAGLGTLPDAAHPTPKATTRVELEVLVVGGGIAGRAVARALPGAVVVDASGIAGSVDASGIAKPGDASGSAGSVDASGIAKPVDASGSANPGAASGSANPGAASGIAIGVYGACNRTLEVLVVGAEGAVLYAPRALVLAPGAHEVLPVFENNDLPGVLSLRGALALAQRDVDAGQAPLVVEVPGATGLGRQLATRLGYRHVQGTISKASGGGSIERVVIDGQAHDTDALVIDGPRSPAFELGVQAGATAEPAAFGFRIRVDADGRAAPGVWACGEATGIAFGVTEPAGTTRAAIEAQASRVARCVAGR